MEAEGGEGISPNEKVIKSSKKPEGRKTKSNPLKEHSTSRTPMDFIKQADDEIEASGGERSEVIETEKEEADRGIRDIEKFSENPHQIIIPDENTMHLEDYPKMQTAIGQTVEKFSDNPEAVGLKDLGEILNAENNDILAKKYDLEEKGITPTQREWIRLELNFINIAKKGLDAMIRGDKIEADNPRASSLATYVIERTEQLIDAKNVAGRLDSEKQNVLNNAISVFETFEKKIDNSSTPPKNPRD